MESYDDPQDEARLHGEPKIIVDAKEKELKYRRGECSWCLKEVEHVRISKYLAMRSKFQCTNCYRNTVKCRALHCKRMARAHKGWRDDLCFHHHKCYKDEAVEGHCSWCFKYTRHEVFMDNVVNVAMKVDRSFYCNSCYRPTKKCKKCEKNMARLGGPTATSKCFECCEVIKNWDSPQICLWQTTKTAYCPWCFNKSDHVINEHYRGKKKDEYNCNYCSMPTMSCSECHRAMAKCSPFALRCDLCIHKLEETYYQSMLKKFDGQVQEYKADTYVESQLRRESEFRTHAQEEGLIKPFYLLLSMHPEMRAGVARQLRMILLKYEQISGDPHAEADVILFHKKKGIRRRSDGVIENIGFTHKANWYQIVRRAIKDLCGYSTFTHLNYSESKPEALNPSSELITAIEEELLDAVALRNLYLLPYELKEKASEIYEDPQVQAIFESARKEGINSTAIFILFICIILSMGIEDLGDASLLTELNVHVFLQFLQDYFAGNNEFTEHLQQGEKLGQKLGMMVSKQLLLKVIATLVAMILLPALGTMIGLASMVFSVPASILVFLNRGSRDISCPAVVMIALQNFLLPTTDQILLPPP